MSSETLDQRPVNRPRSGLGVGTIVFAGVAMLMMGAFHALQGLVALLNDTFYVVGRSGPSSSTSAPGAGFT